MKTFLTSVFFIAVTLNISSQSVTNIDAFYRDGQVFVTWDNLTTSNVLYSLYRSSVPIEYGYQLSSAQNLGFVRDNSANNHRLSGMLGQAKYLKINYSGPPLLSTQGLFVATTTENGQFYYAVTTTVVGSEDTTIILGVNSLSNPISENVSMPEPVWQEDLAWGAKSFSIYVQFATKVTSSEYPQMTNAGSYPFNFAIYKSGSQPPHPVTFYMRPSGLNFLDSAWGIGNLNDWIVSIDDYTPNYTDGNLTFYYGYNEDYNLYSSNPIPNSGTIYNYTAARVEHTINWALSSLPVDITRVYMTGFSLGAIGVMMNSLIIPSKIAAVFIYAPVFNLAAEVPTNPWLNGVSNRLWGTYQTNLFTNENLNRNERLNSSYLTSINTLNSLPIIYTFCGKYDTNVGWSEKITFYDSLTTQKHGGYHFWSLTDHEGTIVQSPWKMARYPGDFSFFARYRTNLSYPAFSNCSIDNDPGNGSSGNGDPMGTINGYLDWNDDIVDTSDNWEVTLKTKNLITVTDTLFAPDSCTADVTLRRIQRFNVSQGNTIHWSNKNNNEIIQQGSFIYNGDLITISDVKIYKESNRLKLYLSPTDVLNDKNNVPSKFMLSQNYPNPFNPLTTIGYQLPVSGNVTLKVYDLIGSEVATLVDEFKAAGKYEVEFDASSLASGVYLYKLTAAEYTSIKKLMLMK